MHSLCRCGSRRTLAWCSRRPCASTPGHAWSIRGCCSSDDRPYPLAPQYAGDSAGFVNVEDDDGELVGLAKPECVRIHDSVVLDDCFLKRELRNECGGRVGSGI